MSTIKEDTKIAHFADNYIKEGMNGKRAYQKLRPKVKDTTAMVEASKLLTKPKVQKAIADRMPSDSKLSSIISTALEEKPKQDIDWSTKHKYLVTALKLKGYLNDEHTSTVNVGLFTSKE